MHLSIISLDLFLLICIWNIPLQPRCLPLRPTKPSRSVVVPFIFILLLSSFNTAAMFSLIASDIWTYPRRLRHHRHIGVDDGIRVLFEQLLPHFLQKRHARNAALYCSIGVREMLSYIAQRRSPQKRIHQRMQSARPHPNDLPALSHTVSPHRRASDLCPRRTHAHQNLFLSCIP